MSPGCTAGPALAWHEHPPCAALRIYAGKPPAPLRSPRYPAHGALSPAGHRGGDGDTHRQRRSRLRAPWWDTGSPSRCALARPPPPLGSAPIGFGPVGPRPNPGAATAVRPPHPASVRPRGPLPPSFLPGFLRLLPLSRHMRLRFPSGVVPTTTPGPTLGPGRARPVPRASAEPAVTQGSCRGGVATCRHQSAFEVPFAPRDSGAGVNLLGGCLMTASGWMLFCGPSGLSRVRPAPAVPVPPSAGPGSVSVCPAVSRLRRFLSPRVCVSLCLSVSPNPGVSVPVSACASPRQSCPPVLALPVRVSFRAPPPTLPGLGLAPLVPVQLSLSCCPSAHSLCVHPGRFWSQSVSLCPDLSCPGCPLPGPVLVPGCPIPVLVSGCLLPGPGPWVSPVHPCPGP